MQVGKPSSSSSSQPSAPRKKLGNGCSGTLRGQRPSGSPSLCPPCARAGPVVPSWAWSAARGPVAPAITGCPPAQRRPGRKNRRKKKKVGENAVAQFLHRMKRAVVANLLCLVAFPFAQAGCFISLHPPPLFSSSSSSSSFPSCSSFDPSFRSFLPIENTMMIKFRVHKALCTYKPTNK